MADSNTITMALKNALSVDVTYDNQVYIANCSFENLKIYLNSANVQQLLIISGYALTQFDDGFDIFYNNKNVGKLYGNEKRVQENEEEDYEFLFHNQDDELLDSDLTSMDSALLSEIFEIKDCLHEIHNNENPNVDNVKVEYGELPNMYNYVSHMDADAALKHGKDYFESLRIRTESFIGDLKKHQYAKAKKMKENFDIFLKNISEKIEEGNEIWGEINELKEEWEEVQSIFDQMKQEDNETAEAEKKVNIVQPLCDVFSCDDITNRLVIEECGKSLKKLLAYLYETHTKTLNFMEELIEIEKATKINDEFVLLMGQLGYCGIIVEPDLTKNTESVSSLIMKKGIDDCLLLETGKSSDTNNLYVCDTNESFRSRSSSSQYYFSNTSSSLLYKDLVHAILKSNQLFDKYLPKFQRCSNTKNLQKLYISILKEVVKNIQDEKLQKSLKIARSNPLISKMKRLVIHQCPEDEIVPKKQLGVKMIFISPKHVLKDYHKLEATPKIKEKIDKSARLIEEYAEKILMEYKNLDAEVEILKSCASGSNLVIQK